MKSHLLKMIAVLLAATMVIAGCSKKNDTVTEEYPTETINTVDTGSSAKTGDTSKDSGSGFGDALSSLFGGSAKVETKTTTEATTATTTSDGAAMPTAAPAPSYEYDEPAAMSEGELFMEAPEDYYSDESGAGIEYFDAADDAVVILTDDGWEEPELSYDPEYEPYIPSPRAGLLTAGEWNDNKDFAFIKTLLADGQSYDYSEFFTKWGLSPFNRLAISVKAATGSALSFNGTDGEGIYNAEVTVTGTDGSELWKSRTDNNGMTYAFYNLTVSGRMPAYVTVNYEGISTTCEVTSADLMDDSVLNVVLDGSAARSDKALDLMFVIDTTGSMGDEITYLQTELEDVINRVSRDNGNIPIRLSVNFYRDIEDDYVVRSYDFDSDIDRQLGYLRTEYAMGGGDYEEAVEMALDDAVNNHSWDSDAVKLMFMVLDAPPHNTSTIRESLAASIASAVEKGIRIIPVASSGVDKDTEFLLRAFAMTTGGTYTFLTDDSGIGGSHMEPTVGAYEVEYLNELLIRVINEYLQ